MFVTLFVLMVETNYVSRFAFWQGAQGCPAWVSVVASCRWGRQMRKSPVTMSVWLKGFLRPWVVLGTPPLA